MKKAGLIDLIDLILIDGYLQNLSWREAKTNDEFLYRFFIILWLYHYNISWWVFEIRARQLQLKVTRILKVVLWGDSAIFLYFRKIDWRRHCTKRSRNFSKLAEWLLSRFQKLNFVNRRQNIRFWKSTLFRHKTGYPRPKLLHPRIKFALVFKVMLIVAQSRFLKHFGSQIEQPLSSFDRHRIK